MQLVKLVFRAIASAFILWIIWIGLSAMAEDKRAIVHQAVSDYVRDYNVGKCYLDWVEYPLEALVLWVLRQESWMWDHWLASKHNNRGNLKLAVQYPLPKQWDKTHVYWDGGKYYSYDSAHDWIYDVAHWINTRGKTPCNVTTRTFTIYINWHANVNEKQKAKVKKYLDWVVAVAKNVAVETTPTKQPQIIENKPNDKQKPQIIRKKRHCRSIILTIDKGEYLELSFGWKIRRIIRELWYGDELRICKDI